MSAPDGSVAPPVAAPPDFTARRLLAGLLLLGGLTFAGIAVVVLMRGGLDAFRSVPVPRPGLLLVGLALTALDVWLGGLRVHQLAHRLAPRVTIRDGIRADLANRCLAGITPWQTGGGAAQLYVLARAGLPLSGGVAVGTINFLVSTVVLVGLGFTGLALVHDQLPGWLQTSTEATLALLILILILGGLLLAKGRFVRAVGENGREDGTRSRFRRAMVRGLTFVHHSLETARGLMRAHRGPVLTILPITMLLFIVKLAYTFSVFKAFHPGGQLGDMIAVMVILVIALNFAPTPGGSGIVEGSATAFLVTVFDPGASVGFVLYWRLLTLYLPVVAGGLVLLHQLNRDSQRLRPSSTS